MIEKLKLELKNRFQDLEENSLIAQATLLDPRFKKIGFIDERKYKRAATLYTKVANTTLLDEMPENGREENVDDEQHVQHGQDTAPKEENLVEGLWKDFDVEVRQHLKPDNPRATAIIEVDKNLDEPILPRKDSLGVHQDPLVWWSQRKHIYPKLYQIMKTRLCIMATSVPCERIFSKAGQIMNENRERLKTDKISEVVFLSYNLNNND
ncbi:unnamed protein product [Acanthoscelides obtectus]|uniref:HAT C-terminal dimerisation domain-containing protein n=1 Tax=Acanthoscelides obtectus TaxID=200917 RepID=A0A9P0L356_ACAOB|nr:unnamed protein product [Acanthoscelides obtectus]CAK1680953.1 Zinc finger BED domain-containing protein 1 [Acanthoscelides obtectus]